MSKDEISLLAKGLKFCPTPSKCNNEELTADIFKFCRSLRLCDKFCNEKGESCLFETDDLVYNKSDYNPPKSSDKYLEDVIDSLKKFPVENNIRKHVKSNLSYKQKCAIDSLKDDHSIIIKEADKGSAVVIMNTDFYCEHIHSMLNDVEFYTTASEDFDTETRKIINDLIQTYDSCLHDKEKDYLVNFIHKTSFFYGLPKIHKSTIIGKAIEEQNDTYIEVENPTDLKFRPIVGGPNSATQRLSHFLDLILKPLCNSVNSYIKDDFDFLGRLPRQVQYNCKLVSFDVVSLYTNIPHDLGKEAVKYWLNKKRDKIDSRFSNDFILEALDIVLERNSFYFDQGFFQQVKGTAMGTKVAPTYATLVLGYLEEMLYSKIETKFGENFTEFVKSNFLRFLDDCFIIWPPDQDIEEFRQMLNSLHPSICYTMESSETSMPFLDVLIQLETHGKITTDLYCKTTDAHNYLNFYSNHSKHTKVNIPFNLASRIITIVSEKQLQDNRLDQLRQYLKAQCYPVEVIEHGISKAIEKGPFTSRVHKQKSNTGLIPFVSTFNPLNTNVFPLIKNKCEELNQSSSRMRNIFNNHTILHSRRQPRNLKQMLTCSKFDNSGFDPSVSKCRTPRCGTCPMIIECSTYMFKNGLKFTVKANMNCKSKCVIYALICSKCGDFYIGQTSNELRIRMTVHRQQTKTDSLRNLYVNKHIHDCASDQFNVLPIYQLHSSDTVLLERKEDQLIKILKPSLNRP